MLGAVKARPGNAGGTLRAECRPALTPPCARRFAGRDGRMLAAPVEPKNGNLEEDEEAGGSECTGSPDDLRAQSEQTRGNQPPMRQEVVNNAEYCIAARRQG